MTSLDQLRLLDRKQEIPDEGLFSDIMWSDPGQNEGFVRSSRGAGYLFGADVTQEFMEINDLKLICRAHQLMYTLLYYYLLLNCVI